MTITDNTFYILYVVVKHRNKRFVEGNVPNDLIPDEIAIKTRPLLIFCR